VLTRSIASVSRYFRYAAAAAIVAMMALTCADVVLRLLRRPIPGTYELVGFLGALAVALALAQTSVERGHISVTFLVERLPPRWQRLVDGINAAVASAFFALVAWHGGLHAGHLREVGEVSMTLQAPVYPIAYGLAAGCALLSLVLVSRAVADLASLRSASRGDGRWGSSRELPCLPPSPASWGCWPSSY